MGATMAEKILGRASGRTDARSGDYVTARPDFVMSGESAAGVYLRMAEAGVDTVWDSERIILFLDHYSPPLTRVPPAYRRWCGISRGASE